MERLNRNGGFCRRFLDGDCPFGEVCQFRHVKPTQICRHFQKGGCWFGDNCKFLHVFTPGHPEPGVSSLVSGAPAQSDRRAPEVAVVHTECGPQQQHSGQATAHVAKSTTETSSEKLLTDPAHSSEVGGQLQESASNEGLEGATAAPPQSAKRAQAFLQSKDLICGICMDKIYEKPHLGERKFGILPNCTHAFCIKCIQTWRKTRDFAPNVVKSCPQCRVKSGFYVPHDYWVEGQEKESLIAAFKKRFSKKTCGFYLRQGRCPFKSDCLYRHDKTLYRPPLEVSEDTDHLYTSDVLNFLLAMALIDSEDEEDEEDDDEEFNIFDLPYYLVREHIL